MAAKQKKHEGGRPTKYGASVIDGAREYLNGYKVHGDAVPTIVGLCRVLKLSKSIVYDWCGQDDKQEFSDICKAIEAEQERRLVNGGLKKEFQPQVTMLLLGKHGYSAKQEIDHTSGGDKIEPTRIIFERVNLDEGDEDGGGS